MTDSNLIPIREQTEIAGTPQQVWAVIADPLAVVNCIPGAMLEARQPDGVYPASITVKFGPTIATFSGEVQVTYDEAARRCTVEGRGIDERGASSALVNADVTLAGAERTVLTVDGGFNVTGPLETFASAGGVHIARALLAEFAANIGSLLEQPRAEGADAMRAGTQSGRQALSAGTILWRAFRSWLRELFTINKQA